MFPRFALLSLAALAAVATAAPSELGARQNACASGSPYCCNQGFNGPTLFNGALGGAITGLLGLNAGLTCNPITGIGAGGTSCTSQTACCSNTQSNGLIVVQCVPINVTG